MRTTKVISVDFQKDFSAPGGKCYRQRPCIDFIKDELTPYFRQHGIKITEIISDYRLPRPGDEFECCVPGTAGYESEIPPDIKDERVWVKCMNSPVWIRGNGGQEDKTPGLPHPNTAAFSEWLHQTIGRPEETDAIVLIGLTLDCCVMCTGQELSFRGYPVKFLIEGVDTYSGDPAEKKSLLKVPLLNWGEALSWNKLKEMIEKHQ